jgi:predicted ATP-dependent endonuclease of OLD family
MGQGPPILLRFFLNNSKYRRELVDNNLLTDLNKIVSPDVFFESIAVRRIEDKWEVFLNEKVKGFVSLSNSGSGLKTILLVLINTISVPKKENNSLDKYIFIFEELENNLHPAIQRKLLAYIRDIALKDGAKFFITTHSNIVIDLFSKDKDAQIYHVVQNDGIATVKPVTTYIETSGILDDLDIRASDLLQSNGLIWVEGPSDRIYINKFIELWSEGSIKEGLNYQCVFYGGRVLAHLSADIDDELQKNLLNIILTNRNAIILMDSDKKSNADGINATKERVRDEIKSAGGICWITAGITIENYIPDNAIISLYNLDPSMHLDQYKDYQEYLEENLATADKKFYKNKVLFAEKIRPHLHREDLEHVYDLSEQVPRLIEEIKKWNRIQ